MSVKALWVDAMVALGDPRPRCAGERGWGVCRKKKSQDLSFWDFTRFIGWSTPKRFMRSLWQLRERLSTIEGIWGSPTPWGSAPGICWRSCRRGRYCGSFVLRTFKITMCTQSGFSRFSVRLHLWATLSPCCLHYLYSYIVVFFIQSHRLGSKIDWWLDVSAQRWI
jgi:hypothetical protein